MCKENRPSCHSLLLVIGAIGINYSHTYNFSCTAIVLSATDKNVNGTGVLGNRLIKACGKRNAVFPSSSMEDGRRDGGCCCSGV